MFGFSKLDVMFGKQTPEAVRLHYRDLTRPHVRFRQETVTAIDPTRRHVVTDLESYEADVLVIALGADYDVDATPGLVEAGNEFYSVVGAESVRDVLPSFDGGRGSSACAERRSSARPRRARRRSCWMNSCARAAHAVTCRDLARDPFGTPIPPSPATSDAILAAFADRDIVFVPIAVSPRSTRHERGVLDDGRRLPFDLFLGIPVHRAPAVVEDAGLSENGWIPVDPHTLGTRFPGVYAVGDVTSVGTPKAGVFAERQASVVAEHLIARIRGESEPPGYDGTGTCYVEFGDHEVGRVDVDFYSTPGHPTGTFVTPSVETAAEKAGFAASRRARWFGG